ncbi:hypothetical protein HY498_05340 [Candidatus Woesearchaeota archaeon]|nr:hypothetical protein [Candidatus Woesearchaeota archaeon]
MTNEYKPEISDKFSNSYRPLKKASVGLSIFMAGALIGNEILKPLYGNSEPVKPDSYQLKLLDLETEKAKAQIDLDNATKKNNERKQKLIQRRIATIESRVKKTEERHKKEEQDKALEDIANKAKDYLKGNDLTNAQTSITEYENKLSEIAKKEDFKELRSYLKELTNLKSNYDELKLKSTIVTSENKKPENKNEERTSLLETLLTGKDLVSYKITTPEGYTAHIISLNGGNAKYNDVKIERSNNNGYTMFFRQSKEVWQLEDKLAKIDSWFKNHKKQIESNDKYVSKLATQKENEHKSLQEQLNAIKKELPITLGNSKPITVDNILDLANNRIAQIYTVNNEIIVIDQSGPGIRVPQAEWKDSPVKKLEPKPEDQKENNPADKKEEPKPEAPKENKPDDKPAEVSIV